MSEIGGKHEADQEQSVTAMVSGTVDTNDEPQDQDGHEMGTGLQENRHQDSREVS